jgi:oligopeptide transport system substrate-binding protein
VSSTPADDGEGVAVGRQSRGIAALVLSIILLAGACSSGGGEESGERAADGQVRGGEFSISIEEPTHLLPQNTNDAFGGQVLSALFTGLVEYDVDTAEPRNALAESITSSDQQTWTIKLKDGWTFHNGEPVTARSFVDAWNFAAYAPNAQGNASFFAKVEGYDALQGDPDATPPVPPTAKEMTGLAVVDDTTFTVRLKEPFSQFPITLGYQAYYPLPKVAFSDPKAFEQQPIGNGPFMMDGAWRHDEGIRVKAYPGYQGRPARADAVEFRIYAPGETAVRDLQGGNLDIVRSVAVQDVAALRAEFPDGFVERPSPEFNYLGFPLHDPAFAKKELRQAFSMAIDRKAIIEAIFEGANEPAASVIAPVVPGARRDPCSACRFDKERARQLLARAGGWKGTLRLWFRTGKDNEEPMEAIANQLRQNLGITDVTFETMELAEFFSLIKAKKVTGPFRLSWLMDYPSPQSYLEPLYSSTSSSNRTGYVNPQVDQLIADHSERVDGVVIDPLRRIRVQDVQVVG